MKTKEKIREIKNNRNMCFVASTIFFVTPLVVPDTYFLWGLLPFILLAGIIEHFNL